MKSSSEEQPATTQMHVILRRHLRHFHEEQKRMLASQGQSERAGFEVARTLGNEERVQSVQESNNKRLLFQVKIPDVFPDFQVTASQGFNEPQISTNT
jgi:hypothetical protein